MRRRLSISSEKRVQKYIQNKRMFQDSTSSNELNQNQKEKEGNFISFLVLGIDCNGDEPKPSVLAMFPSRPVKFTDREVKDIISFCYPQGFKQISSFGFRNNKNQDDASSNILNGFVFYLQSEERMYGVVLHICIPSDAQTFISDKFDRSYPFCLCVISKNPDISSHFTFLNTIAELIIGNAKFPEKSVEVPEELKNRNEKCLSSLLIHPKCPLIAVSMGIHPPRFILPDLLTYYSLKPQLMLNRSDYLLYPTLQTLFTFFTPKDIVSIYTYILYEVFIVFTSTNMNRLSFCILAITNLVKGLTIESKIFPILPATDDFRPIFDSPMSFILGYPHRFDNVDVVIDIDKGRITENTPLPKFPYASKLVAQIKLLTQNYIAQMTLPPKVSLRTIITKQKYSPDFVEFTEKADSRVYPKCFRDFAETKYIFSPKVIQSIIKLFYKPFVPSLADFVKMHLVTDTTISSNPVTVFNQDMFLYHVGDQYQDFMKYFTDTQMFQDFVERLADEVQTNKNLMAVRKQQFKQYQNQIFTIMKKMPKNRRKSYPKVLLPKEKPNFLEELKKMDE